DQADPDRAAELFDLVFDDDTSDDFFAERTPEIDEHGMVLTVPRRPFAWRPIAALLLICSGWLAWSWLLADSRQRINHNAMAGAHHDHAHDHGYIKVREPVRPSEEA
ncbi:MAG: hypothetical protein AAFX99_21190, partial [Myxococcota bacterium]